MCEGVTEGVTEGAAEGVCDACGNDGVNACLDACLDACRVRTLRLSLSFVAGVDSADAINDAQVQRVNRSVHFCLMSTLRMMMIWQEMEAVLDAGPTS